MTGEDTDNDVLAKARAQYAQCSTDEEAGDDQGECAAIPWTLLLIYATLIQLG
jgi:hypothetical protein